MSGGFVYFMTNRRDGTLYAGVTSDLPRRAFQHRNGTVKGFTKSYGLKTLVYYEQFDDIRDAIQREKVIKHWPRVWEGAADSSDESRVEGLVRRLSVIADL